ncbi:prepilin-type N-terminal cleavage/methylation domain-containing protein [Andreprevotia lacus]|jgi:type IV fimbrial biogenesis protein FimT|uniref:prepilin-type N-terminal cleavage/methylation domain-containing protein n=1 Tax=Andreprevotia lacus TaxID=1121000 RepID=UPI001C3891F6|nr:prepilin-type N-terminal cleavage/methylation domain-containing protein [Andreprevotia lacus]
MTFSNPLKKQTAFTLIELLVVLSVVGILAVIALPSFSKMIERWRLVSTGNKLATTFANARSDAIAQNTRVCIRYIAPNGTQWGIWAYRSSSALTACSGTAVPTATAVVSSVNSDQLRAVSFSNASTLLNNSFIDPTRGVWTASDSSVTNTLSVDLLSTNYTVRLSVSPLGRASLCVPSGSTSISGVSAC